MACGCMSERPTRCMRRKRPFSKAWPKSLPCPANGSRECAPDDRLQRGIRYSAVPRSCYSYSGILDHPSEPVIGLAEGETRWRGMTVNELEIAPEICPCHDAA